jgi:hypothetical protein
MFCAYVFSIKITKFKNMNTFRKQWFDLYGDIPFFCVSSMKLKIILKNTYNKNYFQIKSTYYGNYIFFKVHSFLNRIIKEEMIICLHICLMYMYLLLVECVFKII